MSDRRVVVVDIDLPFWRIVGLLVKWAIAAIPAGIILGLVYALLGTIVAALFGATSFG